jgi:hypothetical protein
VKEAEEKEDDDDDEKRRRRRRRRRRRNKLCGIEVTYSFFLSYQSSRAEVLGKPKLLH